MYCAYELFSAIYRVISQQQVVDDVTHGGPLFHSTTKVMLPEVEEEKKSGCC